MSEAYPRAIDLVARASLDVAPLVTERFGLADTAAALDAARSRRGIKVVVEPHR